MTITSSPEKNVEAVLLKTRTFRRKPGDIPYPVKHFSGMSNFDIWDNMFFSTCCRGLTMHQFDKPPTNVLDLGCGSGFWAIQAAKQWTSSSIVGYDCRNLQPNLFAFKQHGDIAQRVRWVHGNLLEGLPFPSFHFDFVRVVGIGLGVPEDEVSLHFHPTKVDLSYRNSSGSMFSRFALLSQLCQPKLTLIYSGYCPRHEVRCHH